MTESVTYAAHGDPDYNSRTAAGCEAAGEPVFTLRAQDAFAAETVRSWIALVRNAGGSPSLVADAERIADAMSAWPVRKLPD